MLKIKLKISGMGCESCERAVENALKSINGIKFVKADAKKGTAEVEADVLERPLLERAVEEAGYQVTGIIE